MEDGYGREINGVSALLVHVVKVRKGVDADQEVQNRMVRLRFLQVKRESKF